VTSGPFGRLGATLGKDPLQTGMERHVLAAHHIVRGRRSPRHRVRGLPQSEQRLIAQSGDRPLRVFRCAIAIEQTAPCSGSMRKTVPSSLTRKPSQSTGRLPWSRSAVRRSPAAAVAHDSSSLSGKAAMYTSSTTFADVPASVMTAPPYEWPTSTTGPSIPDTTLRTWSASPCRSRIGPGSSPCPEGRPPPRPRRHPEASARPVPTPTLRGLRNVPAPPSPDAHRLHHDTLPNERHPPCSRHSSQELEAHGDADRARPDRPNRGRSEFAFGRERLKCPVPCEWQVGVVLSWSLPGSSVTPATRFL
jgi:hypothetical protein